MRERQPVRDNYDAVIDLAISEELGAYANLIVKFTYKISNGFCVLDKPEPLYHDMRDENIQPRLKAGTDFWPIKLMTDVVVQGSAFAPGGTPIEKMEVSIRVGKRLKRIAVFGRREIIWDRQGRPCIEEPEPFFKMPLIYENAYGGIDWRVAVEDAESPEMQLMLQTDHPGMYPRNPFGKGYLVVDGEVPDMEMPNLEDPDDLLTVERLIVGDPALWYRQPLPWCFDWVHPYTFPRYLYFLDDVDAWFPGPEDEDMPEVQRGFLKRKYRSRPEVRSSDNGPHPMFYQEASYGMIFSNLRHGEEIVITGMHPEKTEIAFRLPDAPPELEIEIEGSKEEVKPNLHSVICKPSEEKVILVYGGLRELQRLFIPGIHKHIPIAGYVNGDRPLVYEAPPTVKEKIEEARKKDESNGA